jgi:hypothetical protein
MGYPDFCIQTFFADIKTRIDLKLHTKNSTGDGF